MPKVKVWNRNTHDLKSMWKGDPIEIKAGQYTEMDFYDAHEFKGQYHPVPCDAAGKLLADDRRYWKILEIEPVGGKAGEEAKTEAHVCMQCKHASPSPEELEAHIKVRHADASRLVLPEEDREIAKKVKKTG